MGGLVPGDTLKMIEEAALNDEVKLQTGFEAYDACSSKSINFYFWFEPRIIIIKEMDDECTTAAEMYACGKEKEPAIVDAIFGSSKGNATVVCVLLLLRKYGLKLRWQIIS